MPRPAARFTETDLKRALKVARAVADDLAVRVLPDGSIEIYRKNSQPDGDVDDGKEWVF